MFTLSLHGKVPYRLPNEELTKERAAEIVASWRSRAKIPSYHVYAGIKSHLSDGELSQIIIEIPFAKSTDKQCPRYEYHGSLFLPIVVHESRLALYAEAELDRYLNAEPLAVQARFEQAKDEWECLGKVIPKKNGALPPWGIRRYFDYSKIPSYV